ncbi:MAG: hypothetical protein QW279_08350 [Candidatus Jordarchaeaceae archaeon]
MEVSSQLKYVEDLKVDEKVVEIIEDLKNEIVSRFHPKSIIISGSFGKGEATVVEENGRLKFLSDCEVIIIPYRWVFNRKKLDEFEKEFFRRTGLKIEIWGFTPTIYLIIPFMRKRMRPSIANYDLKYGSKVIYGKNYLKKIPNFKPENIPIWEGIRLILNRMAEALEYFSPYNPTDEMIFWNDKIVLACQDALLLKIGKYTPSYKERNRIFKESINEFEIPSIQTLASLAVDATNRKLKIQNSKPYWRDYWFQVSKICDEVLRYVIETGYNVKFADWLEFPEKYMNSSLKDYTTLPFDNTVLQNCFRFLKKLFVNYKLPNFKMMIKPLVKWDHMIYSHIPLLYFGIRENYEVNSIYLKKVASLLKTLGYEIKVNVYSFKEWMQVKEIFNMCWHQMKL